LVILKYYFIIIIIKYFFIILELNKIFKNKIILVNISEILRV